MFDTMSGEKHVADVRTARGMVIEFQNSAMSVEELRARESFYGRMIWIVNAAPFRQQFSILSGLPDPASELGRTMGLTTEPHPIRGLVPSLCAGLVYWDRRCYPDASRTVEILSGHAIEDEIKAAYAGHHQFAWKRPREVWLEAKAPVFFDFGDEVLWWLQFFEVERGVRCVRWVAKSQLVQKNGGDPRKLGPITGLSPLWYAE